MDKGDKLDPKLLLRGAPCCGGGGVVWVFVLGILFVIDCLYVGGGMKRREC